MKMKKITNPKWMRLLKILHLLGMVILCTGLLGTKLLQIQSHPDLQTVAILGANFTRNGGILVLGTGLIYNLFTRYGFNTCSRKICCTSGATTRPCSVKYK